MENTTEWKSIFVNFCEFNIFGDFRIEVDLKNQYQIKIKIKKSKNHNQLKIKPIEKYLNI